MWGILYRRLQLIKSLYLWGWRWVVFVIWGLPYGLGAFYDFAQGQGFLFTQYPTLSELLPSKLPLIWLIVGIISIFAVTIEGAYRLYRKGISSNLILDYEFQNGKLPVLPQELHGLFPQYIPDQLVTKDMKEIPPSGQFLRKLSYNQSSTEFLFGLLIWQGKDPRGYIGRATGTPIVWSGQNPKELARDFVNHWQNIIGEERRGRK